ncbi:riboflavin synthase [Malassezia cuniculi]|uniref:Riboflavin synthase n=1 Tax=Malassezia cuniculi TaxID=948313 RepID=A0AAF0ESP6_9BASI|nr:riboflavin synthase [Malassezia cuniculi]
MFTGLIERIGRIVSVSPPDASSNTYSITVGDAAPILDDCHIGDSIAVNGASPLTGACLTVTQFQTDVDGGSFRVDLAPETLRRTNLGDLKVGDTVNCERAMAAHTRFGGHIVQGHVDTVAELVEKTPNGSSLTLRLRLVHDEPTLPAPAQLSGYIVPKGFITLDGASLTLIDVSPVSGGSLGEAPAGMPTEQVVEFTVMLIPHTQEHIGLPAKQIGDKVNVEFDMVGKYVLRSIGDHTAVRERLGGST